MVGALARLTIRPSVDGAIVRLCVSGELDIATSPLLSAALAEQQHRGCGVVLDLAAVEFLDVAGLRVLIEAQQEASRRNQSYAVLATVPPPVGRVLDLTGARAELRLQ